MAGDGANIDQRPALSIRQRSDTAGRRAHEGALDDGGRALVVQGRDQRLTGAERGDGVGGVEGRVLAEGVGRRAHRFLLARRIGAQRVLHAVAELGKNGFRHVERVLRHEIDADALGADKAHDLFHAFHQHPWRIVEEQMRLIEEEHETRLFRVAHLRQFFEEFREHPEQEGGVKARVHHQPVGGENRNGAAPVRAHAHDVGDLQRRFAKEIGRALLFENQQPALQRTDRGLGNQAELVGKLRCVFAHIVQERLQVFEIEQRQPALIGDLEGDVEHTFLRFRGIHQPGKQQRPHFGDGGAHAMAFFAVEIPEDDGGFTVGKIGEADLFDAFLHPVLGFAFRRDAGKVALDVGAENRHAGLGETFGKNLQRHGLARSRRAGDEAVAVAEFQFQIFALVQAVVRIAAGPDIELSVLQHRPFSPAADA
ncbi:hypothetical protein D3C72_950500 [compost metagenome]